MSRRNWRHGLGAARAGLAGLHLLLAWVSFIRPHMTEIIPGYVAFGAIADTRSWGTMALVIGLGLLLIRQGQPLLILWQFASAAFFALFSILVTQGPYELTWGSAIYGGLAFWSVLLAYVTADDWFYQTRWPQRFRAWLRRRRERRERR